MSRKSDPYETRTRIFRVKFGHAILAIISLGSLIWLAVFSVSALQAHEVDKRAVFSQESDAAAMTFAQRESFNVLLAIHEWAIQERSAREVQITRALLGQRLQVQTQSGATTYDLTEPSYQTALKIGRAHV